MDTRIAALELRLTDLERCLETAERRLDAAGRRLGRSRLVGRAAALLAVAAILGLMSATDSPAAPAHNNTSPKNLDARLTAVEAKTAPLSVAGSDFIITGKNVHVLDGSGFTDGGMGLGNLTIGYNALRGGGDVRTGTHNLIVGDFNSYSSFGGLVAGINNEISGVYATVTGGEFNWAAGPASSVSGGDSNFASGAHSSVSGGFFSEASALNASVSGGSNNLASGGSSSVSGGFSRSATGAYDWVAGPLFEDD